MSVASWCCTCFCVVLCVSVCTGHFVMVPLNLTYQHCLHSFFNISSIDNTCTFMNIKYFPLWMKNEYMTCSLANSVRRLALDRG